MVGHLREIHDPVVRRVVSRAAAADLERRLMSGLPAYLMGFAVILLGTPLYRDHPRWMSALLSTFSLLLLVRWWIGHRCDESAPCIDDARHRWMRALALLSGALWGTIAATAVHFYGPSFTSMLLLFLTAGYAAGASSSMSLDRRLSSIYFALLVGPPAVRALLGGTVPALTVSLPCFFFLAFVHSLSRSNHRVYWSSILDAAVLQQKTAELERARDAAESSSRSRTAFLATVSHELRTPLHGVLGLLRLLADSRLDREQRDHVEMAQRSAGDLLRHINDILDYTKFATKGLEGDIQAAPFDIRDVVEDTLDVVSERAAGAGLDLAAFVAAEIPRDLRGDAFRLRQVLVNLVSNAVKFTEAGHVTIEVAGTKLEDGASYRLDITVADTGIGMSAQAMSNLFNPFSQADSTIARRFGGTGLGLAIVRGLCRAMGGDVTAESTVGVGSRFVCRVLLEPGLEGAPRWPHPGSAGRALIVSPNLPSTRALRGLLSERGLQVDVVATREEIEPWREAMTEPLSLEVVFVDEQQLRDTPDQALLRTELLRALRVPKAPRLIRLGTVAQRPSGELDGTLMRPVRRSLLARALLSNERARVGEQIQGPAAGLGLKVLVVDDNAVNRLISLRFLEKLGCAVESASDGIEALARWEACRTFDLVLMDCQMPKMDGLEATQLLRQREQGAHVPVIAMTASAALEDKERCLAAGMDDFLAKPVTFEALGDAVKRWATKRPGAAA